ncbi:hypothetical protein Prudu_000746 [Prunus dulcis]|uniref:Uncharacterized protein n=1 Tax=Prunus dulcis TaxID=3755 RepID=A0A4Y1QLY3_PRUDU|nr:hypothetical protein Prudu_000746 [Prunus dulcis]
MEDPSRREIKVEIDSGGEDVFAAHPKGSAVPEHLVIMVNGIIGSICGDMCKIIVIYVIVKVELEMLDSVKETSQNQGKY